MAGCLAAGGFFFCFGISLKNVGVEGSELVISALMHSIWVPLRSVEKVSTIQEGLPLLVRIDFRERTEFGLRIRFLPRMRSPFDDPRGEAETTARNLRHLVEEAHGEAKNSTVV